MACLEKKDTHDNNRVLLRLIKSNYSGFPAPLELIRDQSYSGLLRLASGGAKEVKIPEATELPKESYNFITSDGDYF
jgi:hypothetical protein